MTRAEYVVDASAAALAFLRDPRSQTYRDWFIGAKADDARLGAPVLLQYELVAAMFKHFDAHTLRSEHHLVMDRVRDATQGITLDDEAWTRTGQWAGLLSPYDAQYLALAVSRDATLVTYDRKLAKIASEHVPVIGPDGLD